MENPIDTTSTYRFPLKSNSFPFIYQSTDGSGIPLGGVQFKTTGPPTKATVSFGTNLKSSRSTEMKKRKQTKIIFKQIQGKTRLFSTHQHCVCFLLCVYAVDIYYADDLNSS